VWLADAIRQGLGSVCLYGTNIVDATQVRGLCTDLRSLGPHLVLATDEEGGDVTRLHYRTGSPEPGNAVLGRLDDVQFTRSSAQEIGAELATLGIDLDLAPVVDVNSSDDNPVIGTRSFGGDAALVARHTAAWVEGLQSQGVAACAKHFPGHGDTVSDSHLTLPIVDVSARVLRERELVPFRAAIEAGVASVMTAAIVVTAIDPLTPATFSAPLLQGLLRDELGFTGVIVSDALDMAGASADTGVPEAAVKALVAGCDLLCLGSDTGAAMLADIVDAVIASVQDGRLAVPRLRAAADAVRGLVRPRVEAIVRTKRDVRLEDAIDLDDAALAWLRGPGAAAVVQVDSATNVAVGQVPWGPAGVGLVATDEVVAQAARVAVVGRNIDADHAAWEVVARYREQGKAVIVVECGWPRGGSDVVVRSGSPEIARRLVALLMGSTVTASI
jgi:beta-N-acetylhexosaminidase